MIDTLGYIAAILTTTAFVPQVWHTWRLRRTDGLSFGMLALFCTGVTLWLVYGVLVRAPPIVVANAVTLALNLLLVAMKLGFRSQVPP